MKLLDQEKRRPIRRDPALTAAVLRTVSHKFGGSSLASATHFRAVAEILTRREEFVQVTVVSAMRYVTDSLVECGRLLLLGDPAWRAALHAIAEQHIAVASDLLVDEERARTLCWIDEQFSAMEVTCSLQPVNTDELHGLGEIMAAELLAAHLRALGEDSVMLDARGVLVVAQSGAGSIVDWGTSGRRLAAWRTVHPARRVIVTGYIAQDASGQPVTLGRNGSDYSGAIFAALFAAEELHIWTDVDGVLSADPRLVPDAVPLEALSYHEACELAYFGARVVHPQTMLPAMSRQIPIFVRNTSKPELPGTRISQEGVEDGPVKGVSLVSDLALLNVEGGGMIGVPGTAERYFAALRESGVSVTMISQGSSEHSICCVVRADQADRARAALRAAFAEEIGSEQIEDVQLARGISVLAAVGEGMSGTPGVAGRLFSSLARARVNIRAIAQGSSERNISLAIDSVDATKALRAAHAGFWLSPQTVSIGVIGAGRVGTALLDQLHAAMPRLGAEANLDLRLRAISNSRSMALHDHPSSAPWRDQLAGAANVCDLEHFTRHLEATHLPHSVIIDCSGSEAVADWYPQWLAAGIHVITPSKHGGAGNLDRYRAIRKAAADSGARFRYEATVGAGLPVIGTLRDLLHTGDDVLAIDGILSGTLAWLFNRYDGTVPFSELVREAHALGYTEPDARDDLSGTDVARKLVILAREAGHEIELSDVHVESLVPEPLRGIDGAEFMSRLHEMDEPFKLRFDEATARGMKLRYVARLDSNGAAVRLQEYPAAHAFSNLRLTDNIVQFTTRRYCENPLIVQGPGAGPEVTAAGVFADLLRVAASFGARL